MFRLFISTILLLTVLPSILSAQETPDSTYYHEDSTGASSQGVVTVTARRSTVHDLTIDNTVPRGDIQNTDAGDVAGVLYEVPAARVQENSRGEANLYLRNAGERQVAIFFDGALLNVPWDNRVDLSLLPSSAIGELQVSKGAPSVLYGANTMGGAVNILTRDLQSEGSRGTVEASVGSGGYYGGTFTYLRRSGVVSIVGTVSHAERDGAVVPSGAELPYGQPAGRLRTNTDNRKTGLFLRGGLELDSLDRVGISLNVVAGSKGVAPEGHLDPTAERVRFWRYPDWTWVNTIGSFEIVTGEYNHWSMKGSTWLTHFSQTIDQYADSTYRSRTDEQSDKDFVLGGRAVLSREGESSLLSVAMNHVYSSHRQIDSEIDGDDVASPEPEQQYAQYSGSYSAEWRAEFTPELEIGTGASIDLMTTIESDDKPAQDLFLQPGISLSADLRISPTTVVGVSLGRKSRFPSMRELYGVALNRFLINPDLQPESAWSGELSLSQRGESYRLELVGFGQLVNNTIDQRTVMVNGNNLRQRYNLAGSTIAGAELGGSMRITSWLKTHGHVTWTYARSNEPVAEGLSFLSEKPDVVATLNARADLPWDFHLDGELRGIGKAYTLNQENGFTQLPSGGSFNLRLSWIGIDIGPASLIEVYLRGNNLGDIALYNQLGLPESGRELRGGVKLTL